jgi:hypothetical protein
LGFAIAMIAARADAQATSYPLAEINFDMWCQETQHLPPDRCDKRLPKDDADFEAFIAKYEKYEIPYLQRRDDAIEFNKVILHNDPVDHPVEPSAPQTDQPATDSTYSH